MTVPESLPPSRASNTDRRFLPRAEPGRRVEDSNRTHVFADSAGPEQRADDARPLVHLSILLAVFVAGLSVIAVANMRLAPLLFYPPAIEDVARSLSSGTNYATFDLNIESRALRHAHITHLPNTPDIAVLGASHWQEAHANLIPEMRFYNAHVHRDYYQDMLAVVEMFLRNNRLPRQIILTIRDDLFTPVSQRKDFLWIPAMPFYRDMAHRLGLPAPSWHEGLRLPQYGQLISLATLRANFSRWLYASELPQATALAKHDSLDILMTDGSINWSRAHDAMFTRDRARAEALAFAARRRSDPPQIDPMGVVAIDRLLAFLQDRGVDVSLAHPPFNPLAYDALRGSPYMQGLARVEQVTRDLAEKYGLSIIGAFDPDEIGCSAEMYIDAEHANPTCLQNLLAPVRAADQKRGTMTAPRA